MCIVAEKLKFLGLAPLLQPSFLYFGVAKIAILAISSAQMLLVLTVESLQRNAYFLQHMHLYRT